MFYKNSFFAKIKHTKLILILKEDFMDSIRTIINSVNNFLWGYNILVVMLVGTALYLTIRTRFMQFRLFTDIIKILGRSKKTKTGVSSLEAFLLGTACRVGAGNITGVIAAISVGGAGAIFWMWLVAMFGAATAFVESTLAVIYRKKEGAENYIGGTPWIIKGHYNKKWLGVIYAVASIVCYMGVIQVMSNSVTESISNAYHFDTNSIAIALAILITLILFARTKKDSIIVALNKLVPLMAILYLIVVIYILITNFGSIPAMLKDIAIKAFGGREILGGGIGIVIMQGVRRGLFSNEAGSGNANYAAAAADVEHPANQGMVQALGVFVDTIVICSATAFIILLAGDNVTAGKNGMALFQVAIEHHIGWIGIPFSVVILFFFALSTILGVAYYGKTAIAFIGEHKWYNIAYLIIVIAMVYIGGIEQNFFVWSLADFGLGIMTVINIIVILPLTPKAITKLDEYEKILNDKQEYIEV